MKKFLLLLVPTACCGALSEHSCPIKYRFRNFVRSVLRSDCSLCGPYGIHLPAERLYAFGAHLLLRIILILVLLCVLQSFGVIRPTCVFSQPLIEWQYDFSKSLYDRPYSITTNSMNEIVVCGATWNDSNQTYDGTIMKLDFMGNIIWQKNYGYGNSDLLTSIAALPSTGGGYVAAGRTDSKGAGAMDFWIIKINENGDIIWEKTYGEKYEDKAEHILVTKNGNLLVTGSQMTVSSSTIEMWVVKLNPEGEKIWDKKFGGHFRCYGQAAAEINDKILIAGYFEPTGDDKYKENKARVTALDQNGSILWEKIFGGKNDDEFSNVLPAGEKEFLACGYTKSKGKNESEDFWTIKFNDKGEIIWEQVFGDIHSDKATGITAAEDGFVICGSTDSRETNSEDILLVKYDFNGKLLWSTSIGKDLNEKPYAVISTPDGGFVIASEKCTHYNYDSKPVKCQMNILKLGGTPKKSVENYVSMKVKAWEKKGEFEKTDAFQKRVNEENRKKIIEKHTREAILYYGEQAADWSKASLNNYDADAEEFRISVKGLGIFPVKVSVDNAQQFKESFSGVQFENPEYSIKNGKFVLEKITMVSGGKEFSFNTEKVPNGFLQTGERKTQQISATSPNGTHAEPEKENLFRGSGDPLKGLNVSKSKAPLTAGKFYALIVGVDNYKGAWEPLNNAVRDAQAVELLLKSKYKFDNFKTLYDEQATRTNIINAFVWLVENVSENDNVFVYYSGHGEFNKALNKGYWVPADAQTVSISAYISNSDLQTFLGGIKAKHTLLVSDACFSGDIFRGNTVKVNPGPSEKYYTEAYNIKSRQAISSGGIEPVMDGGKDGHSVFAYYFLQALKANENEYLDASQLFDKLKVPVINNSEQKPQLQSVKNTGDEGGQFIFIRK